MSRSFKGAAGEHACLLLQVHARHQDMEPLEEECVSIIKHALLGTEGEAWSRLDGTLKELNGLFKGFLAAQSILDVHAIVAIIEKNGTLHVSHAGRGEAWLLRSASASQITEFSRGKPVPNFIHISSGTLESGDTVVFSTQRLMRALTPAQLSQLSGMGEELLPEIAARLQAEDEVAALATLQIDPGYVPERKQPSPVRGSRKTAASASGRRLAQSGNAVRQWLLRLQERVMPFVHSWKPKRAPRTLSMAAVTDFFTQFLADLRDPERRKKAQLLLVAGALVAFLLIWMLVKLSTNTQRNKTHEQLALLIEQTSTELQTAENRRISGDIDAANLILQRAEERAKQVIADKSQLYRSQAVDLLARIREKRDIINNIAKIENPRVVADVSAKNTAVALQGLIGDTDNGFTAFDKQQAYRIVGANVTDPIHISDQDLIVDGTVFTRYQSDVFLTAGNSVLEYANNQLTAMKTDDVNGWMAGVDIQTYARFLYMLAPATHQIYKYERLNNRYGPPVNYNVNGDLTNATDMVIDSSVYVLKKGGTVLKLLRGEVQPFVIRQAPGGLLATATKVFKVPGGNFYFLDPDKKRVVVITDGGPTGESSYVKQYVLESATMGTLQDLFVSEDQTTLYVMDAKKLYAVNLSQ
ncbi:MAG: hypothetical protein JWM56_1078 [Candidatus Peribacteria bacterium]|nr:hypothetical protein [Candidatus Peribacteria bacterium]